MKSDNIVYYLKRFGIIGLVLLFIYDIVSHGTVVHPGQATYKSECAQCHGDDGEGTKLLVPPFNRGDFIRRNFDSLPCWIKNGMNHPILINDTNYDQPMYPGNLDDIQTTNVINYISKKFLNSDKNIDPAWVRERWKNCK